MFEIVIQEFGLSSSLQVATVEMNLRLNFLRLELHLLFQLIVLLQQLTQTRVAGGWTALVFLNQVVSLQESVAKLQLSEPKLCLNKGDVEPMLDQEEKKVQPPHHGDIPCTSGDSSLLKACPLGSFQSKPKLVVLMLGLELALQLQTVM